MKTIVVPTDFSEYAMYALKVAASIAKKVKARIKLVHVYNFPSIGMNQFAYYNNILSEIKAEAEEKLAKQAELEFLENIKVEKYLLADRLLWEIVKNKKFAKADLIVIGSHGRSGFSKFFLGSNTEKIVRLANAPVLTVKNEIEAFNLRTLVFVSDFYEEVSAVFDKIKFLVKSYKPQVYLLKVITPSDFEATPSSYKLMNDFKQKLALTKCSLNIYNSYSVENGIIDFSHEVGADLIAIPTHGRTGVAHLIIGSLAESIAVHEPTPVLSIKIPDTAIEPSPVEEVAPLYQHLEFF